ncbi:MAG: magnesium/cobalt transporter CorA [Candidatus Lokiarchaeota archaeon]|nr:magnesium/cobalt transporter CorA [Candidatus Lokiarchaeota archaeon]
MADPATCTGEAKEKSLEADQGHRPAPPAILTRTRYNESEYIEEVVEPGALVPGDQAFKGVTWVDVNGVEDKPTVEKVGQVFYLHPVILEDVMDVEQRPKIVESLEDSIFIEFNTFLRIPTTCEIQMTQFSVVLTKAYLITFQQDAGKDFFKQLRDRIKAKHGIVRKMGVDFLLYLLLEFAIDNYYSIMEDFEESIDRFEDDMIEGSSSEKITSLQQIKRSLIYTRKSIWPVREILNRLEMMEPKIVTKALRIYFRNLYEQIVHLVDMTETFRDILSTAFDIHLSTQSNKLNVIVKTLTIISVVFTPLNLIVGFFGMNWLNEPEYSALPMPFLGLIIVAISMFLIAALLVRSFRKRKWF